MATQSQSAAAFYKQLGRLYGIYTGAFLAFIIFVGILELLEGAERLSRLSVRVLHAGGLRHHRRCDTNRASLRVLRRRPARAGVLQRHGDGRRLDVGGFLRRHGGHAVPGRLRRHRLGARLDRRVRAGLDPGRALPAQVRRLYRARLHGVPVRRQLRALPRRDRAGVLLLHVCDGADLRHRPHRLALPRHAVRDRGVRRPGRHPDVRDAGRHAGGDVDADRTVHRADRRLPDADRDPVHSALRLPDPRAHLRAGDRGHHGARAGDAGEGPHHRGRAQAAYRALHQLHAAQLLRHHLLHDGGYGVAAAHPDALLHDAQRA